ncbi:MAG: PspC domain-containing protein [Bacteroidaceae bacterium]|nr:PspC domain-containing protein [Bacteroidaceae bacterium]
MKKNITINFFGTLYAIDEDAYELLNRYLGDMKKYFSRKEGGEEIADDIEHRVAELMLELKNDGREPIDIELVKEIIGRIGNPEELDDVASEEGGESPTTGHRGREWFSEQVSKKRLYCNPDDKMLCGVLSGISCYLGIDPVWVRLAVVALAILPIPFIYISFWTVLIVYVILALIIPEAKTPEERLRMHGKPVTMENLNEEIVSSADESERPAPKRSKSSTFFDGLVQVLVVLIKAFLIFMLASLALGGFALLLLVLFGASFFGVFFNSGLVRHTLGMGSLGMGDSDLMILEHIAGNGLTWVSGIAFFVAALVLVILIVHAIMRVMGKGKSLGRMLWIYLVVFFVSLIIGFSSLVGFGMEMDYTSKQIHQEYREQREEQRNQEEIDWLTDRGWEVIAHDHTNSYMKRSEHYSGDRSKEYIDGFSEHPNMLYTVERTVRITPGIYSLEAAVRTNGEGPEIYAFNSKGERLSASFPVYANYGGEIWQEAMVRMENDSTLTGEVKRIAEANRKRGHGWSRVHINNIEVTDSIIRYGVTNRNGATGYWNGTWFSATDFKLSKVK